MKKIKTKAFLIFNEGLNSLAIVIQETANAKSATLQVLDDSFKEKKFTIRNVESMIKDHHWLLLGEL